MHCYATFFLEWMPAGRDYFDFLLKAGISPEVGMEHGGFEYPPAGHRELAERLRDHGLAVAAHLPYFDIMPGSPDKKLRRRSLDKLLRAVEIAALYGAVHLIGHPNFWPGSDSAGGGPSAENKPSEGWLERSALGWEEILKAAGAGLYLENTDDQTPEALLSLLERLPRPAGLCFDVGHWHFAARGRDLRNLGDWLAPMMSSGRLEHLHLHDNDGAADRHWGLGRGGIDFHEFFGLLKACEPRPTFTLEAHRLDSLKESLAWLQKHEEEFT